MTAASDEPIVLTDEQCERVAALLLLATTGADQ
jgi:hypothetical protein